MKTQNATAYSYHSKVTSTQNKGVFSPVWVWSLVRSSHPEVFCKKGVLRNFAKFAGKHLCKSPFFNKVAGLRPKTCIFIKKRPWHRYFHVNFAKFLRTPFLIEHLWWLLLFSNISFCLSKIKVFPITLT